MKDAIIITKTSENKYEFTTKGINIEPGEYFLYGLEKNLFVIKRQYFGDNKKKPYENKKDNNGQVKEEQIDDKIKSSDDPKDESTKEWYKKALELKKELIQNEFMILNDLEEVRKISYVTKQEITSGEILGIRGFDKNYYIFKKSYFDKIKDSILDSMNNEPTNLEYLLEKTKLQKEELTGVIELLKEQSDIIEVKKGLFKKI